MLLLYFHYTYNSYNSNDIPLSWLVLKRKAEAYEEDEILEDEQDRGISLLLLLFHYASDMLPL